MKPTTLLTLLLPLALTSALPTSDDSSYSTPDPSYSSYPSCPPNGTLSDPFVSASAFYTISPTEPNRHFAPSLTATLTPNNLCFITNLLIPASAAGSTCTLRFLFPTQAQAHQHYTFAGPGHFTFTGYATGAGADEETTWDNQPEPGPSPPSPPEMLPGNAYTIFSGPCGLPEGATEPTVVSGRLCSADTELRFTQQSGGEGCALGFFVELS